MNFAAVDRRGTSEWFVTVGEVASEDRDAGWGVVVVPFDDPFEERAEQPDPPEIVVAVSVPRRPGGGEPTLVVLEM